MYLLQLLLSVNKMASPPVWPVKQTSQTKNATPSTLNCGNVSGEGEEEDTSNTVPTFKDAFEDSLSAALKNATAASNDVSGRPGGSKAVKKSKKKMVLFTTGNVRRGYSHSIHPTDI